MASTKFHRTPSPASGARLRVWSVGVVILAVACGPAWAEDAKTQPRSPADVQPLIDQLTGPDRTAEMRLQAATLLLNEGSAEALRAMQTALTEAGHPDARQAVAEAVAAQGGNHDLFIEPLLAMLSGEDPALRPPAARALMAYKNHRVFDRLVAMTRQASTDRSVRLALIAAFEDLLDKRSVGALIDLLSDSDESIRTSAAGGLVRLTGIRAFGNDADRWRQWWARNKDKPPAEWLGDLVDPLARSTAALQQENRHLRTRLAKALMDLYLATPADRRRAVVEPLLTDPLVAVRLTAIRLLDRLIVDTAGSDTAMAPDDVRELLTSLLGDEAAGVRAAAATLAAQLGDPEMTDMLLASLAGEQDAAVRRGLLMALGQLRDPRALQAVLPNIGDESAEIAMASARALGRIADKHALSENERAQAVAALLERYRTSERGANEAELREALLTAMGVLGDRAFAPCVKRALAEPAATVRLAAVAALQKLGQPDSAKRLAPLVEDDDRGVRRAAIAAIGTIGGQAYLPTILKRTQPEVEADADVRQQAWETLLGLLATADVASLTRVADALADRPDAVDRRITILQMLVVKLQEAGSDRQTDVRMALGLALVAASREAEAVGYLAEAYAALSDRGDAKAAEAWDAWVAALLLANDPDGIKALAEIDSDDAFIRGLQLLVDHLTTLEASGEHGVAANLTSAALDHLPHRLTVSQREHFERTLARVRQKQKAADRGRVTTLVTQMMSDDESARNAAQTELQSMGDRAVKPLLAELREAVSAAPIRADTEKAILGVLRRIAPELTGYDTGMNKPAKLELIDSWRQGR